LTQRFACFGSSNNITLQKIKELTNTKEASLNIFCSDVTERKIEYYIKKLVAIEAATMKTEVYLCLSALDCLK
jgi:hypothetical protein